MSVNAATAPTPAETAWTPLALLGEQYAANRAALASRDPALAARIDAAAGAVPHYVAAEGDRVTFSVEAHGAIVPLPNPVTPAVAGGIVAKLFSAGACNEAVTVAGIDQGWIWDGLYRLPCASHLPMHRPPLFFLAHDATKLWAAMHVHDWSALLADPRVSIFAGPNAAADYRDALATNPHRPLPRLSLTVEPALWRAGDPTLASADAIYGHVLRTWDANLQATLKELATLYPADAASPAVSAGNALHVATGASTPEQIVSRFAEGHPLRVLGITSLYTTFLQHSMRDWLAAFEIGGHTTHLVIESADHESMNNVRYLHAIADFRPDLIVIIDHYRAEFSGMPASIPVVMWVQDRLPNIFSAPAGAAQGSNDFCLGFGRQHLASRFGYPAERFLTCPVGINEERFAPRPSTADELAKFGCDVSYVSHASETAEAIVEAECGKCDADTARFLRATHRGMVEHYARDARVLSDVLLRRILAAAGTDTGTAVPPEGMPALMTFFTQRVNSAMVRHESLLWLADAGVDLRLYGRGWENHPRLACFARGVVDNKVDLAAIYRCSKINLQVTSFGSVHQRMLDGLAAGAFFLTRWSQGDAMGNAYRAIWDWCEANDVRDDATLRRVAPKAVLARIAEIDALHDYDTATYDMPLYDLVASAADAGFTLSADSVWGDDYDRVAYRTRDELLTKVTTYLADAGERHTIAMRMREATIARFSYRRINEQLLAMIARTLAARSNLTRVPEAA